MHWFVDGNNVMGAGADGWWNDPPAAAERLTAAVAAWTNGHQDAVTLVFDGRPQERLARQAGGRLRVLFAERPGRDAADDRIVDLVTDADAEVGGSAVDLTVVTSDRGLMARLPAHVQCVGAGTFRQQIGLPGRGRHPR